MNTLGVILARAGSVGLPNKHLRLLLGRSVIEYTLDHAMEAKRVTKLVVSSDCAGVRLLAQSHGIEAINRPADLATGDASVQAVMLHAMKTVEENSSFRADALVVLYGNVAVRGDGIIDSTISLLEKSGCDSVRTFCPVGKWHPAWMSRLNGDRVEAVQTGSIHRRQDLTPLFLHDGAAVAVSRSSMLCGVSSPDDPHAFFGLDRRGIQTGMGDTIEIDHLRDLFWAEAVLRERQAAQPRMAS